MEVILQIHQVRGNDENHLTYEVKITQGADQVTSEDDLYRYLKNTIPGKKGIISTKKQFSNIWEIVTFK